MSVNCKHWNDGACALNLFGGRPSPGVCANHCKQREPIDATKPAVEPSAKAPAPVALVRRSTVGDEAQRIIGELGFAAKGCASCERLIAEWNSWTVEECRQRIDRMEADLLASAKKRGLLMRFSVAVNEAAGGVVKPTARQVVERAIAGAKDKTP